MSTNLLNFVDNIVEDAIVDIAQTGILPIHPNIFLKHRSVNLLLGKPGSSKTTSIIKKLIKLSMLIEQGELTDSKFHLILEHLIKIPLIKMTYDHYKEWYPQFVKDKKKNHRENYETIIVLDDALGEIKNEKSEITQPLSVCRHVNCLMILVGQQALGSIPTKLTSLLNTVWIFKGYTRNNIITIRQNTSIPFDLNTLWNYYSKVGQYQKLICDNDEQRVISF
ncbi:Uncharacterized protein QTN25_004800 [Entamoeba marina]